MESGTVPGACLCGAVTFTVELPTLFCAHCHCTMCRRAHGAGYVTWLCVPTERFQIRSGADGLVRYRSSDHGTRSFCGTCGSHLFFESAHRPDQVDVVLANMQGEIDHRPQFHAFFDDRASWLEVRDDLPRLGGATGFELLQT
jgi:hypothetical protein